MANAALVGGALLANTEAASATQEPKETAFTRKPITSVSANQQWPILTRYSGEFLNRIAFPIGGLGTGCIALGGRGELRDWELVNLPAYGYQPANTCFLLWTKDASGRTVTRCLEGVLPKTVFESWTGAEVRNHSLPRFRKCDFNAAYPLAQVMLQDPDVPLLVRLEAFNPLIPADADGSGYPVAMLRYVLINPTNAPIEAAICGTLENFIGWDGHAGKVLKNINEFRTANGLSGIMMRSDGVKREAPEWGTLCLATSTTDVTHRLDWADLSWGDSLLDFWRDVSEDGRLNPQAQTGRDAPLGSLAPRVTVPANGETSITFYIGWHFPNRKSWIKPHAQVGNYYCEQHKDAWDAIRKFSANAAELEKKTVAFVRAMTDSDLPTVLKDACLSNLSTLKTQVVFRTSDGRFFGWEGAGNTWGSCHGSCMHVWNYESTTPYTFGALAKQARETDFKYACDDRGRLAFRIGLPLKELGTEWEGAAADGQMGTILRLYREWKLSGDEKFIRDLYPNAKRALEFAWIKGGWDADKDGVMEGCQHNTMDIEYYGPNPEVGVLYLGALRAVEDMAKFVGDSEFAGTCASVFASGSKWFDENLFNGDYYEHKIIPTDPASVAPGLAISGDRDKAMNPVLQVGKGCMSDQLLGQVLAHICSLGYLLDRSKIRKTLQSIMKFNYRDNFYGHFNHLRSYALNDDQGLIIATYPHGGALERPFPYAYEVWSGIEWTAAAGMIYEGQIDDALKIAEAVRARHDGERRNPFSEEECGRHYARAMASWGCLLAYTGFSYDGVTQTLAFKASTKPVTWFFSTGYGWGTLRQDGNRASITVLHGEVPVKRLQIGDKSVALTSSQVLAPGNTLDVQLN